jgi:hypothetical protein
MTVTVFTKKMRAINGEGDKNRKVCGATNPLYNRPPPQKKIELGAWCQQIELLQHVIYSKHVNWLKVWNFHLSQIISQQNSAAEHSKFKLQIYAANKKYR